MGQSSNKPPIWPLRPISIGEHSRPPQTRRGTTLIFILFFGSAIAIYLSCEFFVNGVEWVGKRLNLSQNATGTILAAFGTALPESVVTLVAVAFGDGGADKDIGVGAALGGPLALSTIAYAAVGFGLIALGKGRAALPVDGRRLSRDQQWFLAVFVCKIALGLVVFALKPWLGILFLATYGFYVAKELKDETPESLDLEPLRLRPKDLEPSLFWAGLQTSLALVTIFVASRIFVTQLSVIGPLLGLPPQLVALLLSPIATEMPEVMNAVIWVRQGKTGLALANISGAMMIQATIPTALGLFFTPWLFSKPLMLAAAVTVIAIVAMLIAFRLGRLNGRNLAWSAVLYVVFAVLLFL